MWLIGLWMANARPCARGRKRFMVGPSSAVAWATKSSSGERLWLFSAFAAALCSTLATSRAASWGMNLRAASASATGRPMIARVTRRALRVEWRRYLAVADTRIFGLLQRRRAFGVLAVAAEAARRAELTESVADHVLGHVDRDVLLAVVHGDRVAHEVGEDDARARPRAQHLLLVLAVHLLDAAEQAGLGERALLQRS